MMTLLATIPHIAGLRKTIIATQLRAVHNRALGLISEEVIPLFSDRVPLHHRRTTLSHIVFK
jgi:hypothetical protein